MRREAKELERVNGKIWQHDEVLRTDGRTSVGGGFSIVRFRTNLRAFDRLCATFKTADV